MENPAHFCVEINRFSIGFQRHKLSIGALTNTAQTVTYDLSGGALPAGLLLQRAGSAFAYNVLGNLVSNPPNTSRFSHNPITGTFSGLLLENEASNLVKYSIANTTNWVADSTTPVALSLNALGLFPGVQVPSLGAAWGRLKQDVNITNGATYAVSCFYRLGSSPNVRITISGGPGASLVSGPPGGLSNTRQDIGVCSSITETVLADGLTRRVQFVYTATVGEICQIGLGPQSSISGQDITLLGIQVEQASAPSSFISTASTPATRAADMLSLTGLTGTYDLVMTYSDRADVTLSSAALTPGYVLPSNGSHLLTVRATPV